MCVALRTAVQSELGDGLVDGCAAYNMRLLFFFLELENVKAMQVFKYSFLAGRRVDG